MSVNRESVKKTFTQKINDKSKDIPLKGFKITISTKFDVSDETIQVFTKWAKKATMHHIVLEHGSSGTKHLHALVCYENSKIKRNIQDFVWRHHVKNFNEGNNIQKYAVRVDVLYDSHWIEEYLKKEANYVVHSTNYDAQRESDYYPEPGVKEALESLQTAFARSDYWGDLATKFEEHYLPKHHNIRPAQYPIEAIHEFYFGLMFAERSIPVISDDRRRRQNVYCLWLLVNKITSPSYEDRKYYASHDGPVCDFSR